MPKVEVSSYSYSTNYSGNRTPVAARLYASASFVTDGGDLVAFSPLGSPNFYKEAAVTVVDGIITIGAFSNALDNDIDSTTRNGIQNGVTYTLVLVDAQGKPVGENEGIVFDNCSQIKVPTTTPTTWQNLVEFSLAPLYHHPFSEYYTADQVDILFGSLSTAPDASDVVKGRVKLSRAPVLSTNPIAIGDNDERVNDNVLRHASLAAAITAIGSTPTILEVSANTNVSTSITVPDNVLLLQKENALIIESGTGTITFQGQGVADPMAIVPFFQGFEAGDITWTGTVYPKDISTELFDTGNSSSSDRVKMCDLAFANDKNVTIHVYPRTFTANAFSGTSLRDGHSILLKTGEHLNTLSTRNYPAPLVPVGSDLPVFVMGDNSSFTSEPGAIFYESSVDYNTYLVYTKQGATNVVIENNYFLGQGADHDGGSGGAMIRNAVNGHIRKNMFNACNSYNATIGGNGSDAVGSNVHITDNTILATLNQVIAVTNGRHWTITGNQVLLKDGTGISSFVPIDVESNNNSDILEDGFIDNNVIDIRGVNQSCIGVQVLAAGPGAKRITVGNNPIIGQDIGTASSPSNLSLGLLAKGVEGLTVYNNPIQGGSGGAIRIQACRYVQLFDNPIIQCGEQEGVIGMFACADSNIYNNILSESADTVGQSTNIKEFELSYTVSAAASTISRLAGNNYAFYSHFRLLTVTLNATDYTVTGVTTVVADPTLQTLTTGSAVGTLPVMSVASATDVNTGTDTITFGAHNYINGARLLYTEGSVAIGGLTTGTTYFVVGRTGTTVQLSLTLGGAVINLTGTGTGTQTFTAVMVTKFSNNLYWKNLADDGIVLESTGSSRILDDVRREIRDSIAVSITSNQNNYNPGRSAHRIDVTTDASRNITGLVFTAPPQLNGEKHEIYNAGSFDLVLVNNATSTAANRFQNATGADFTLTPGQTAYLEYNSTLARWMVIPQDWTAALALKRNLAPRVTTTASSATPTPNADTSDLFTVTALATNATFGIPSGTPANGQQLTIRILDNGVSRTLGWNAIYREFYGAGLPTSTTISKTLYIDLIYNSADVKWDTLNVREQR